MRGDKTLIIITLVMMLVAITASHYIGIEIDGRKAEVHRKIDIIELENERLEEIKEWQEDYLMRLRAENRELREILQIPLDE